MWAPIPGPAGATTASKFRLYQRNAGIEAATLSIRLVNELNLGPRQIGNAHWLVGAHHIAAGCPEAALASLDEAARAFASAGDRPSEMMARGYCALARKLCPETRAAALAELDQVLQRLGQEGSKAATFYQFRLLSPTKFSAQDPKDDDPLAQSLPKSSLPKCSLPKSGASLPVPRA